MNESLSRSWLGVYNFLFLSYVLVVLNAQMVDITYARKEKM